MGTSDYKLGLTLVTASAIAWSTAGYFTRLLPLDSWTMLAWRGLFGALGIVLAMLALNRREAWHSVKAMAWPGWIFAIVSAIGMVFFITSLRQTTVAHVAVIYATVPFMAAALGWLMLRERPSLSALIASLAALIGVGLMVGVGTEGGAVGDLLAIGMTLSMAAMMVISRRYPRIPTMPAAALSALLSGMVCWPMSQPLAVSGHELLVLALFGLINSAVGLSLFTIGARHLPAIETALIGSLDAPLAPLWVWLAFGETPAVPTLAGGSIVFAAVIIHVVSDARRAAKSKSPFSSLPDQQNETEFRI
jgi:drug/metabolite transporter (DMT)-like permease